MPHKHLFIITIAATLGIMTGVVLSTTMGAVASAPDTTPPPDRAPLESPAQPASPAGDRGAAADTLRRTAVVEAVERVAPAVVSITTTVPTHNPFGWHPGRQLTSSEGSGVVIDAAGIVLTNAHVVEGSSRITASFADGSAHEAQILGLSPDLDLAVLRLHGTTQLTPVPLGQGTELLLGEPVIAIGNPFGLGHTVTTGVVSATRRPLETDERVYQDFIQTDAGINPGNSGGHLLNIHGELIGINTAIRTDAENIGFAIPADRAIKVARDLVDHGSVQLPWLGVDLTEVAIRGRGTSTAAVIDRVYPDSHAAQAGLKPNDIIMAVDDHTVQGRADLNAYLAGFSPDQQVRITLIRGDAQLEKLLTTSRLPDLVVEQSLNAVMGIEISDLPPQASQAQGVQLLELRPDGEFARRGLRPGDLIVAFNGQFVHTTDELRAAIRRAKSGHRSHALITIRRGAAVGTNRFPI